VTKFLRSSEEVSTQQGKGFYAEVKKPYTAAVKKSLRSSEKISTQQ
jgi:hypothetical protein